MQIKLLKASVIGCITYPTGKVIEVADSEARHLIAMGKAAEYVEAPKKTKRAKKKSPSNRMIEDSEVLNRDAG